MWRACVWACIHPGGPRRSTSALPALLFQIGRPADAGNKLAFYEPAIKVWHRKRNFYHGVTLVLCQVAELPDRLATETALIRSLRPDLNHPFVSQTLSQLRLHEARLALPKPGTGQRFAQRAQRFRKNHTRMDFDYFLSDRKLFISLGRLGSNTMHKFLEARVLRSRWISLPQLYLRQRLCNLLDEPWRTRAMKQLRLILIFRRVVEEPSHHRTFLSGFLLWHVTSNEQFEIRSGKSDSRPGPIFLRFTYPLTDSLRSRARLGPVIVFNFRASLRAWMPNRPHDCTCSSFRTHDKALNPTRHVFCHVRESLPGHVLADLYLKDTSYLPTSKWKECAEREVRTWTRRWRLPSEVNDLWDEWIAHRIQEHETLLEMDQTSILGQVEPGLQRLQGLVLTPAAHFPHTAHVVCQFAFDMLLDKTFLDTNVFQRCKVGTQSILINLRLAFQGRKTFRHRYQWAVNWNKLLPVARVLPKPSKSFTKARPIIACDRCWHSRLTIFLARALYQVMMTCFPTNSTFNIDSTLLAMRRMWFMTQNAEEPTNLVQQDAGPYRIFQLGATRQDLDVSEVRVVTVVGEQRFTLGTADFAGHLTSERQVLQDLSGFEEVCQPTNQDPLDSGFRTFPLW